MGIDDEQEDFDTHFAKRTHVFILCWTLLKIGWGGNRQVWITTIIKEHFKKSLRALPKKRSDCSTGTARSRRRGTSWMVRESVCVCVSRLSLSYLSFTSKLDLPLSR